MIITRDQYRAVATAHANVALCKYWGKRGDPSLNLPATGSLSLTLDSLRTTTEVCFDVALSADELVLNGEPASAAATERLTRFLDEVRRLAGGSTFRARVVSSNDFPTAAGLASSSSGFAALAIAATRALGLELSGRELSILARKGSGSAARSIYRGLVLMHRGERDDGADAYAEPLAGTDQAAGWPGGGLRLLIGIATDRPKETPSTSGMTHTMNTSPMYGPWVEQAARDLELAKRAVAERDFEQLGEITERSCLTMHASAMAAQPGLVYLKGATVDAYHAVVALRRSGVPAYFTCDAGPQPKVLTLAEHVGDASRALADASSTTSAFRLRE